MDYEDYIDFPGLIDHAMREVVRQALKIAEQQNLPGDHHFFISFRTDFPGVQISDALSGRHPREMTIVMQHQFWDLQVDEEKFAVTLSFNNIPERLVIPFQAMTAFADPSVKFGLQFHAFIDEELMDELMDNEEDLLKHLEKREEAPAPVAEKGKKKAAGKTAVDVGDGNVVVTLDSFRKKSTKKTPDKK